ncbi:Uncharacterised protein [Parabacteroides distasonis]|uniref:Uncharacterized protein n=1 Tax=Parabacteroides distasonis TaxID=823 RepID=A0A8D9P3B8_PARDI|nr:Uncharacterised protein [Parabacteroides distasonis]
MGTTLFPIMGEPLLTGVRTEALPYLSTGAFPYMPTEALPYMVLS